MEKQWYYTKDGSEKQGPVPESKLRKLLADGEIKGSDLAWSEGMADWSPLANLAEMKAAPAAAAVTSAAPAPAKAFPAAAAPEGIPPGLCGWMQFVGVMNIVGGVLYLCYLFLGVLLILSGTALLAAKTELLALPSIDRAWTPFLNKLKTAMQMTGIFYIICVVLGIIGLVFYLIMGVAMFGSLSQMAPQN